MKKTTKLLFFLLVGFAVKAQLPSSTFPSRIYNGITKAQWIILDSPFVNPILDTFYARYPGTQIVRIQGADTALWFYGGNRRWFRGLQASDTLALSNRINLKLNISDTTDKWLAQTARLVDTIYKVNDSTVGYTIKGIPYTVEILGRSSSGGGGTGTVESVALSMPSAFTVDGSPITTSGTFNVSGAGTTLQYIRGNGTLATMDTTAIPNFYEKARGLLSATSPIQYNNTTGVISVLDATGVQKGVASFNSSDFTVSSAAVSLTDLVTPGSCTGCDLSVDSKGRIVAYSNGTGGATNNTNLGTGYRILNEGTQGMRTLFPGFGNLIDSITNANGLTWKDDTTRVTGLPSYFYVDSIDFVLDNRIDVLENDQFYLDGTAGNDLNDGQSPERAVRTVARLLELPIDKHDVINIANGSYFREFLNLSTTDSITIVNYGLGAKPIFDAADSAYNSRFALDPSFSNLYGIFWTNSFRDNTDISQLSVWENGKRLIRAASKAVSQSTPGSYWVKSVTQSGGTDSIYVHASNSSNVVTNGWLYEITKRPMGLQVGDGCKVFNMHTRRNGSNDGSIKTGHNAYVLGVLAEDGVKHNFFMSSGKAELCVAWKCDSAFSGGTTLLVSFTTSTGADTMDVVYKNCIAISGKNGAGYIDAAVSGLYLHVGLPAPTYRSVKVDGGYFVNCGTGIGSEAVTTTIQNANVYNCTIGLLTSTGTLNSINNTFTRVNRAVASNNPTVNFHHNKIHAYTNNQNIVRGGITTFNATWNTTYADNLSSPVFYYNTKASGTTANVTMKHNIFTVEGANNSVPVQFDAMPASQIGANITLNCDSNYYRTGTWVFNGVAVTLATMQSTYSQELNSTNGNLPSIFYGDLNTPDFFIAKSNSLFGKGGSASTFDSVYRHGYNLFAADSIKLWYFGIRSNENIPFDNTTEPIHSMNAQNLFVYKQANLYDGATAYDKISNKSRTIYYAPADSLALVPKWYVDSSKASSTAFTGMAYSNGSALSAATIGDLLQLSGSTLNFNSAYMTAAASNQINLKSRMKRLSYAVPDANFADLATRQEGLFELPDITANRTFDLFTGSGVDGVEFYIYNGNTAGGFSWSFSGITPQKASDGTSVPTLVNGVMYHIMGVYINSTPHWIIVNQ